MILSEELTLLKEAIKEFSDKAIRPHSEQWAKNHQFPSTALNEMAKLGLLGLLVPESLGGSYVGYLGYAIALEEIARGDASCSTIMAVHNSVASLPILHYGTKEQQDSTLKPMAKGDLLGAFCLTEPQAGSDAANLKTEAKRKGEHYSLTGTKQFITSGQHADIAIVIAVTNPSLGKKGLSAFIVPTDTQGYDASRIEEKMGQEAAITTQVTFNEVTIPQTLRLGQEGDGYKIALSQLEGGRIGIAAQCIGIAQAAFDYALAYAKERESFNQPIIQHQAVGFRLANMSTQIEAARQLVWHAAALKDKDMPCLKEAAAAKLMASEMAETVCRDAIQVLGGYGYLKEYPVERLYRDVRVTSIYEGTSDIQRLIIARELTNNDY